MTAPEREAQDKMAEILFLADNPTCVWAEYKTPNGHAYNRYMMLAKAAIDATAVTVTEERCRYVLANCQDGTPIHHTQMLLDRNLALNRLPDELICAVRAMQRIASEAALKSTTPQTGNI